MAYDEALAARIRNLLAGEPAVTERRMFGGLSFLIDGHMAVVASNQGGVMLRVDHADADHLTETTSAVPAEMRGRPMRGWLRVQAADLRTDPDLRSWVHRSVTFARSLPPAR